MSLKRFLSFPAVAREFYDRPASDVAPELLGKLLIRRAPEGTAIGRIVETEAYLSSGDPSCHAHRGKTRRNAAMFGPPGHSYVYMIHAKWCLNMVTEPEGCGSAVLIRAIEPLVGVELMQLRRGTDKLLDLARGPARLCQALDVTGEFDGWDVTVRKSLWVADDGHRAQEPVVATPRIGISQAADLPLRFRFAGNLFVSGRRGPRATQD